MGRRQYVREMYWKSVLWTDAQGFIRVEKDPRRRSWWCGESFSVHHLTSDPNPSALNAEPGFTGPRLFPKNLTQDERMQCTWLQATSPMKTEAVRAYDSWGRGPVFLEGTFLVTADMHGSVNNLIRIRYLKRNLTACLGSVGDKPRVVYERPCLDGHGHIPSVKSTSPLYREGYSPITFSAFQFI